MSISQRKIALSGPEQEGLMVVPSSKLVRDQWSPLNSILMFARIRSKWTWWASTESACESFILILACMENYALFPDAKSELVLKRKPPT